MNALAQEYLAEKTLDVFRVGVNDQSESQKRIGCLQLWHGGRKSIKPALGELYNRDGIYGCVILQKCNSVEFYTVSNQECATEEAVMSVWEKYAEEFNKAEIDENCEYYQNENAIRHLFKTAVGVKSVVLGDNQVRGQVWSAYQQAKQRETTNVLLETVFQYTRTLLTKVSKETEFNSGYTSAERLVAEKALSERVRPSACVLGAGSSGQLIVKSLVEQDPETVDVYTSTPAKASDDLPGADAVRHYDELIKNLSRYNVLIAATDSTDVIVSREEEAALSEDCMIFDISSPPVVDLSRKVNGLREVRHLADQTVTKRRQELNRVNTIIGRSVNDCKREFQRELMEKKIGDQLKSVDGYEIDRERQHFCSSLIWNTESFIRARDYTRVVLPHVGIHPLDTVYDKQDLFEVNWFGKSAYLRPDTAIYDLIYMMNGFDRIYHFSTVFKQMDFPAKFRLAEANRFSFNLQTSDADAVISELVSTLCESIQGVVDEQESVELTEQLAESTWWENPDAIPTIPFDEITDERPQHLEQLDPFVRRKSLYEHASYNYDKDVYIVTDYPNSLSFFSDRQNGTQTTHRFRMFLGEWEVASGALRENRDSVLESRAEQIESVPEPYLQVQRNQDIPSFGGVSIGYERLIAGLLAVDDIRSTTPFPRTYDILKP